MPMTSARFTLPSVCVQCGAGDDLSPRAPGWVVQDEREVSGVPRLGRPVLTVKCSHCGSFVQLDAIEYQEV